MPCCMRAVSPLESGSQLEDGQLNFLRDFGWFRLSRLVFIGFLYPRVWRVLATCAPFAS